MFRMRFWRRNTQKLSHRRLPSFSLPVSPHPLLTFPSKSINKMERTRRNAPVRIYICIRICARGDAKSRMRRGIQAVEGRVQVDAASRIARNGVHNVDCVDAPHVGYARITLRIYVHVYMHICVIRVARFALSCSRLGAPLVLAISKTMRFYCYERAGKMRIVTLLRRTSTLQGRH